MAPFDYVTKLERVKATIREYAGRPDAVTFQEIEWVANQLGLLGFTVRKRETRHGWLFIINNRGRFLISDHHKGQKEIKSVYVYDFLKAMIDLELYEE